MRLALVALPLLVGCGAGVQQATITAPTSQEASPTSGAVERWVAIHERSRIDVVGVDVMGGKHPVTFDRWECVVVTGTPNRVDVTVDLTSARGESEIVTRLLKYDLLEVDRFPEATFLGQVKGDGSASVNATIHGVEKGLRFRGTLAREGAEVHFVAKFKISRDAFGIHSPASWDGLVKDDVHIYVDVRARQEPSR